MNRVDEINRLHGEVWWAPRLTLAKAIEAGRLLTEQKAEVESGGWEAWVAANLSFSKQTARNYMKLYERREALAALKISAVSKALAWVYSESKPHKPPPKRKDAPAPPKGKTFTFSLKQAKQLSENMDLLMGWLRTTTPEHTIVLAVIYAYRKMRDERRTPPNRHTPRRVGGRAEGKVSECGPLRSHDS